MRQQSIRKYAIALGMAIALAGVIYTVHTLVMVNDTVDRAFPNLPEQFRADIETSMALAPLTGWFDRVELQFLQFIRYPYLDIDRLNGGLTFDNEVDRRVFSAQERQGLAPKAGLGGVVPLADVESLRNDSLWELGRAMAAAWHRPAGQQFIRTLDTPPMITRTQNPNVTLLRSVFWAAYGDQALSQAVIAP